MSHRALIFYDDSIRFAVPARRRKSHRRSNREAVMDMLANFQISEAAKREIERLRLCRPEADLVAAISFVFTVNGRAHRTVAPGSFRELEAAAAPTQTPRGSTLSVGLHARSSIPQANIFAVNGTDVAVSPTWQPRLAGKVLDHDKGAFLLTAPSF
jgi:hypothetical protein